MIPILVVNRPITLGGAAKSSDASDHLGNRVKAVSLARYSSRAEASERRDRAAWREVNPQHLS
jgi:hypothetical protein